MQAILPTQASPEEETRLMLAFQLERTSGAFEALYRASAPALLAWIEQLHVQRRIAQDPMETLQDAFVNVYRYAGTFRSQMKGGFRAWARTIAANAARRARRRPMTAGVLFSELGDSLPDPADAGCGPSTEATHTEEVQGLRAAHALLLLQYAAAFETLSPRDQAALRMVEVDGLTYAEVGKRLRVGRSNTKMIVFRARKRLRLEMSRAFGQSATRVGGATPEPTISFKAADPTPAAMRCSA